MAMAMANSKIIALIVFFAGMFVATNFVTTTAHLIINTADQPIKHKLIMTGDVDNDKIKAKINEILELKDENETTSKER